MQVETQQHCFFEAPHTANKPSCVWVFLVFVLALTVLASHAVWAKAGGLAPFSTTAPTYPFNENKGE